MLSLTIVCSRPTLGTTPSYVNLLLRSRDVTLEVFGTVSQLGFEGLHYVITCAVLDYKMKIFPSVMTLKYGWRSKSKLLLPFLLANYNTFTLYTYVVYEKSNVGTVSIRSFSPPPS